MPYFDLTESGEKQTLFLAIHPDSYEYPTAAFQYRNDLLELAHQMLQIPDIHRKATAACWDRVRT